jgi:low temperature requirement protein LtrA
MSWKIWSDIGQVMSWFETNDVFQRVQILFQIACLLGFTTNMTQSFYEDEKHNTYTQLVSFYLAARLLGAVQLLLTGILLPLIKGVMIWQAAIVVIPSALWVASIHVDMPNRLALVFIAMATDIFGSVTVVGAYRYSRSHDTPIAKKMMESIFEFYPALNIEHKVERTNALVSLVIGYSVVGIMFQNYAYGINAFLGKAVLGLVQAFMFNWLYFEVDNANLHVHAIRRAANTGEFFPCRDLTRLPFRPANATG